MPNEYSSIQTNPSQQTDITASIIMAFDFGTQKMGIAVGQSLIESTNPLDIFPMKVGQPNWTNLLKIIHTWQPQLLLVGLPLNMDDSESELSLLARNFAQDLHQQTGIHTLMLDERLTSRVARETLNQLQQNKQAKRIHADSLAACLLIENWYQHPAGIVP